MTMKKLRAFGAGCILLLTVILIGRYIASNPDIIAQLKSVNIAYVIVMLVLYAGILLSLTLVNTLSVKLNGKKIGFRESLGLTGTSSIANFFGPLQSGIGIRAVYFKTKLFIPVKRYVVVSLYYYGFYAFFSGIFLLFGSSRWRLPLFLLLIIGSAGTFWYIKRQTNKVRELTLQPELLIKLAGTTFLQLVLTTALYGAELLALGKSFHLSQLISYSGASNFSLFAAITPGAIGVREAFLVFSESLHHLSRETIISANILDRGVYVVFLCLMFVVLLATHTRVKLKSLRKKEIS